MIFSEAGYNLIDEQWIPVMTGTGHARLGLRDVFREAGRIRLSTDAFERFVLTRFMSAILLREPEKNRKAKE